MNSVEVHPVVVLSVLDHHTRRPEGAGRVIGTLLGRRDGDKVEVTNCFAVPHAERGDEVAIGKDFNRQMLSLHLRANRKECVVGWYATALPDEDGFKRIADTSSLIHEFYAAECDSDPVHLVVDTGLMQDRLALKAYKSTPLQVKGEPLANMFHEIRLQLAASASDKICLDTMIAADHSKLNSNLLLSVSNLLDMLNTATHYIDKVLKGDLPPDDDYATIIADTLSQVPNIPNDIFDDIFTDTLQDLLMVTYLSHLTRTQLAVAEKLNAALAL